MCKYTPIINQYLNIKKKYPDYLLFYQIGDFYELFYNDAVNISSLLGIVLTKKKFVNQENVPMAGIPIHSSDHYILRLLKFGKTIVLCNQIKDISYNKKNSLINRVVSKIITPGTVTNDNFLSSNKDNYIGSIYYCKKRKSFGYSYLDILTSRFYLFESNNIEDIKSELFFTKPKELLYSKEFKFIKLIDFIKCLKILSEEYFNYHINYNLLLDHFNILNFDCFGIQKYYSGIIAAGSLLRYVKLVQFNDLKYIKKIKFRNISKYIYMNFSTIKNLELFNSICGDKRKTLFGILDNTSTIMGSRMLKRWIMYPITNIKEIKNRHLIIKILSKKNYILRFYLKKFCDLERVLGRIFLYNTNSFDLINLKNSLFLIIKIIFLFRKYNIDIINVLFKNYYIIKKIYKLINVSIVDPSIDKDNIILYGYNNKLDILKKKSSFNKKNIHLLEIKERKRLNISSLIINYNKLYGFYVQIKKSDINLVPIYYIKFQTLKNYTRYYFKDLKKKENIFFLYKNKIKYLEKYIFDKILDKINKYINSLKNISRCISKLDVLSNLLERSITLKYVKPKFSSNSIIKLIKGRHAILENNFDFNFISNNLYFNKNTRSLLITGPNMGGKSTYMRQIALIVILSYIGSYVPAKYLKIGPIDKIFTRIGFSDDILSNKSTFMVEMSDISNIINYSTYFSLVIIDEMGRGTSFYEGISIAWSCLYYILKFINCMMLFSTHFIELTKITKKFNNIKNVYFSFLKNKDEIIYLYKIKNGICYESYSIFLFMKIGIPKFILNMCKRNLKKIFLSKINKKFLSKNNLCFNKKHKFIFDIISCIDINNISIIKLLKKIKYLKKNL